jgi:hypothetical protein
MHDGGWGLAFHWIPNFGAQEIAREVPMDKRQATTKTQAAKDPGRFPVLEGIFGRVRFETGSSARTFALRNGSLQAEASSATADSVIVIDGEEVLEDVLAGKTNPIVVALQGRLRVEGNLELATRLLLALQAQRPDGGKTFTTELQS